MEFYDTHAHSFLSFDSEENPRNYLSATTNTVALTEHLEMNYAFAEDEELIPDFDQILEWQKDWKKEDKRLLMGVEIGYSHGSAKRLKTAIQPYQMDLKLLSTHHNNIYDYMDTKANATPEEMLDSFLTQSSEALDHFSDAQIFCHFDYGFRIYEMNERQFELYKKPLISIFKKIIDKGLAFELNSKSIFNYNNRSLYEWAIPVYQDLGGTLFSLGSDAHKAADQYMGFGELINLLDKFDVKTIAQFYGQELSHYPIEELKKRF